jgi:alanine racemase
MTIESTADDISRARVDIDLGALVRNAAALAAHARVPLLPMVKADAYGLGVVPVARALEALDPFAFGVATVPEGAELRRAGVTRPVIVFSPLARQALAAARSAALAPTLGDAEAIADWTVGGGGGWHLAIDTGMSRAGVRWDAVGGLADAARRSPPASVFTHFHSSELDDGSMQLQETRFREALAALPTVVGWNPLLHCDNSAAIVRRNGARGNPWNLIRPGVFLYGVGSGPAAKLHPEPVVRLTAPIVELRELLPGESVSYDATFIAHRPSRIATIAVGYADGFRRSLGNRGVASVNGSRVPVVGTVTMDMAMMDVSDVRCATGDLVTLIGSDGDQRITVEDVGEACGLSPYEILTGLRQRLPRRYA